MADVVARAPNSAGSRVELLRGELARCSARRLAYFFFIYLTILHYCLSKVVYFRTRVACKVVSLVVRSAADLFLLVDVVAMFGVSDESTCCCFSCLVSILVNRLAPRRRVRPPSATMVCLCKNLLTKSKNNLSHVVKNKLNYHGGWRQSTSP